MDRLIAGDSEAWEEFIRDTRPIVIRAVRNVSGSADLDDVVQEVYLEATKAIKSFQGRSKITTWLSVIAHRVACRELARRSRKIEGRPPPEPAEKSDLLEKLAKLPERERRVLILFHIEEMSYRDISRRLGIPEPQVGMVLKRARESLARFFPG